MDIFFYTKRPYNTGKETTVTGLAAENGLRLADVAALCDWYAGEEASGEADCRTVWSWRPRWGLLCSIGLHAVVIGLALTVSVAGLRAGPTPPPVLLDVVFGSPGGDGEPGDGAPGKEGKAGGAGPGPALAEAPSRASVLPRPQAAEAVKPAAAKPVPALPKRRIARPKPAPAPVAFSEKPAVTPSAVAEHPAPPAGLGREGDGSPVAAQAGVAGGGGGNGGGQGSGSGKGGQGDGSGAGGHGGGAFDGVFGAGNGPAFARRVAPVYPPQARRFGREGEVVLRLTIDATGKLLAAEVVKEGGAGFDAAALAAVQASSYRPAMQSGRAVPSRAVLRIRFQLSGA